MIKYQLFINKIDIIITYIILKKIMNKILGLHKFKYFNEMITINTIDKYRFKIGDTLKCNLGPYDGWKLGKVIKLDYRENKWPKGCYAPYQVKLFCNEVPNSYIYVPDDTTEQATLHQIVK